MATQFTYKAKKLKPVQKTILVVDMVFGERLTTGGIILPGDDTKSQGIRPRWARVFAIGPKQVDVKVGEYVLVKHGSWTRGIDMEVNSEEVTVRKIDPDDILLLSDEPQLDVTQTEAMVANSDLHRIEGSMHNNDGEIRNM